MPAPSAAPFTVALAARLKAVKDQSPYTVRSLATESGLSVSSVQRYLDGTRDISVTALYAMCTVLKISPRTLLNEVERSMDG